MDNSIKKTATKKYLVTVLYLLERIKISNTRFHKLIIDNIIYFTGNHEHNGQNYHTESLFQI